MYDKRCRQIRFQAYMTVEASLILPMVLCVIIIGIYTSFYLYDRCLFAQDSYLLCLRESYRKDEGEPAVETDQINSGAQKQFGTKYLAVDVFRGSARAEGKLGFYEGEARIAPAVFGNYFLMPKDIWDQRFSSASRKTDPPWSIRSFRRQQYLLTEGLVRTSKAISGTE